MTDGHELRSLLAKMRRRWRMQVGLSTAGRTAAAAALPLLAAAAAGRVFEVAGGALLALAAVAVCAAAAAGAAILRRSGRRPDDRRVARFVEERTGADGSTGVAPDGLVTAVEIVARPDSHPPAFAHLIVANAVAVLRRVEPAAVVPPDAMRRAALEGVAGALVLTAAVAFAVPLLVRAAATAWVGMFPHSVEIVSLTGDARVAAGQPVEIAAAIRGRGARLLGVVPSLVVSAGGEERAVAMSASPAGFSYRFESVDRTFQYRIAAASASSAPHTITALFPPRVIRIDLHYEYPVFTGQPPRDEPNGGDIHGPEGARVRVHVHADKPVRSGELALTAGAAVPLTQTADALSAELVLAKDDGYRVRLVDTDGLQSAGDLEYFIRLLDDRPPDVRIVRPGADQGITPLEEVAIEARADDDHGVAAFDLVYAAAGKPSRTVPFVRTSGTAVARVGSHILAAEELGVQPGDVITYYARARDVARGKRSTETRSDIFFLEVKPFNEEFVAAPSQAMGGGASATPIDGLVAAQKEIITATWNLERRAAFGRSAADVKSVGEAQADLKARVEQLVRGRGGRGRGEIFPPQQVAPATQPPRRSAAADPVTAAIQGMTRALEQLERGRTAEAIPHEMAALQGLLQAQAEVRRRQVTQSASAAGQGGTSRTDRDLSALFDRELQRQQRTNYETPKSSQSAEPEKPNAALDRLRDLARRQEELARRQQALAEAKPAAGDAEQMKRRLERLSREQQELRRELDALEKQLQSRRVAAAGKDRRPDGDASAQGAGDLRRAAEQMREAAAEMGRQNARAAAASSQRAADALRRGERQMREGTTDGRQRAAGDLRLEAQQLADAQRRIAAELSRLEKEGRRPDADGLRRLAAEKDRLAERVDAVQRGARDLERLTPGAAGSSFRDAAQQLQQHRIGERMRATANDLRNRAARGTAEAAPPASASPAAQERQLSAAIDAVVDALAGDATARQLTEGLDRAREMRERLTALEQQVRQAEGNVQRGRQGQPSTSPRGREGPAGNSGAGSPEEQLQRAREQYARGLEQSRDAISRLPSAQDGRGGSTPEHHEFSRSSPGNESFKQDFSGWDRLRKDIDLRLERYESELAARLAREVSGDRFSAGGNDRVPDAYRSSVARYFESLAKDRK